jgi:hypothetical protein
MLSDTTSAASAPESAPNITATVYAVISSRLIRRAETSKGEMRHEEA